jgi:AT-binding transcription factor 1
MQQTPTSSGQGICGGGQVLARNSTKTLKCPKCNWHYKYQETLEIHMKEKHADAEVFMSYFPSLIYTIFKGGVCLLRRRATTSEVGTWRDLFLWIQTLQVFLSGLLEYNLYFERCDLCKYSTTTKGNLSIHMQSDKHLHALQEMPQSMTGEKKKLNNVLLYYLTVFNH